MRRRRLGRGRRKRRFVGHGGRGPLGPWMRACVMFVRPVTRAMFRFRWGGLEHVPPTGGVIMVVNHVSKLDPFTVARFVWDSGRIPRFLIKEGVFDVPVVGAALRGADQILVRRGTNEANTALRTAEQALREGEFVVVYPEGTVTRDPQWWPMLGKTGLARLWLETDAAVLPVAQWGQQQTLDYHSGKLRLFPRKRVVTRAGPVVDLSAYRDRPVTQKLLRDITDTAFGAVRDLLAEERGEPAPPRFWTPTDRIAS